MDAQNPYEQLGLKEDATFDEIQTARSRLTQEYSSDPKRQEAIEAAYDAILMERLRMRQEGKIKVPEGIRFAERLTQAPPSTTPAPAKQPPAWLQGLIDTPSREDILWPGVILLALAGLSFFYPASASAALALGVVTSLYFLSRKERKMGRAVLLSLAGLTVGLVLWAVVDSLLAVPIKNMPVATETLAAGITFVVLWLVTSFLK